MLEARAIVVHLEGPEAIVEARQSGGCGHCDNPKGCGANKLSQLFCTKPRQFRVSNTINARIGEEVEVSIADGVLLRSALTMYFLPLLLAFGGGMLGTYLAFDYASGDAYAAVGAALGLVAGFLLVRLFRLRILSSSAAPVIKRCS